MTTSPDFILSKNVKSRNVPDRVLPNVRKLMYLRWVYALEEGYGENGGTEQPATLSNLAAFIVDNDACPDILRRCFSRRERKNPTRDVYDSLKRRANTQCRDYYGQYLLGKTKVKKTEDNHVLMRRGIESQSRETNAWKITKTGENKITKIEESFEEKREIVRSSDIDPQEDTIRYPVENRGHWEIETQHIPRIYDGKIIDTGESVSMYL